MRLLGMSMFPSVIQRLRMVALMAALMLAIIGETRAGGYNPLAVPPGFEAQQLDLVVFSKCPWSSICTVLQKQRTIPGHFEKKRDHIQLPNLGSPKAHERFRDIIARRHGCEAVFGIIRTDVLRRTPLIGNYMASDKVLLALLSTRGRFHELPDYLFFQREHRKRSVKGSDHEVTAWFDPKRGKEIVFPVWRISWEYFFVAVKGPARLYDRLCCLWEEAKWAIRNSRQFRWDLSSSVDRVLLLRGSRPIYCRLQNSLKRGRQTLPSWLITPIALALISTVEGFHWIFGTGDRSDRSDRTKT